MMRGERRKWFVQSIVDSSVPQQCLWLIQLRLTENCALLFSRYGLRMNVGGIVRDEFLDGLFDWLFALAFCVLD
jgi:hypothetical protein